MIKFLLIPLLIFSIQSPAGCIGQPLKSDGDGARCMYGYWSKIVDWTTWHRIQPTYTITRALYQNPGVAEETAALRGYTLDGVEGYIATLSAGQVGDKAFIRRPDQDWIPVRIIDDAAQGDMDFHARWQRSGLELSYPLAKRLDAIDWINEDGSRFPEIEICLTESDPVGVCTGTPINFTDWYLSTATFN